ncbi:MAG: T9SS type A sorting domain-containing protein [Leptolyngbya sp. SIO3F4]|nr:T9SS type A sorting domain-containing protein [Leptolyngbya sp. SIO3F4]
MEHQLRHQYPHLVPGMDSAQQALEEFTESFIQSSNMRDNRSVYVIPVVFHIIHDNGPENISDAQVMDCIRITNRDFNAMNLDLHEVAPSFVNVIGDARMEFRLAQIDPNGNPTTGIERIQSTLTYNGNDAAKFNPWPRSRYLNVWVVDDIASGAAAYAYLPSSVNNAPNIDGIMSRDEYVGSFGTANAARSRTLTHEIGHYLNLAHPWGFSNNATLPSNCNTDDQVGDTPNTIGTIGSCNTSQVTCGSLDNIQNFMDYSSCERMFTAGQVARMESALNSSVSQRNQLWTVSNLQATGLADLTTANFTGNHMTVCQFDSVLFYDESTYRPDSWSWTFENGSIASSIDQDPTVFYDTPGAHDVSLSVSQGGGTSLSVQKSGYVFVTPLIGHAAPHSEDFESFTELPNDDWYSAENIYDDVYGFDLDVNNGYDGGTCIRMTNFGNPNNYDYELESTAFDLSVFTSAEFSFKYAYARRSSTDGDQLFVYVSTDCGETWLPRFARTGGALATNPNLSSSNYTPTSTSDWATVSLPTLTGSLLGDHVQFLFLFRSDNGNNLYIDDININGTFSNIAQLHFPYDGMAGQSVNAVLEWKPMTTDQYEVQVDTDPAFSNPTTTTTQFQGLQTGNSDTRWTPPGLTINQTYYWRVRLVQGGTPQAWSEVWSFTVDNAGTGVEQLRSLYDLKLYPNPAQDVLNVGMHLPDRADFSLRIFDLTGRMWYEQENQSMTSGAHVWQVPTQRLNAGIYLVDLLIDGQPIRERIVIQ